MDIFIRRLPESTNRLDLLRFVSTALKPKWYEFQFTPLGSIKACEICCIENEENEGLEFHGVVRIEPASAAVAVIKRLNGEQLNSKRVEVRKFYRRSAARDPRKGAVEDQIAGSIEFRKRDRRRPHLVLQHLHRSTTSSYFEQIFGITSEPVMH